MRHPLFPTALLAIALAVVFPNGARSQSTPPERSKIRAVNLVKFVKAVQSYADTLELLDELTETESATTVVGVGKARPEGASFVVTYRVPGIEMTRSVSNTLWLFGEVPGRTVTTLIRTDCLVSEWYDVPAKARDKSNPSTLLIRLTPKRMMTDFPEDSEVHTDLGTFRFEFLGDGDKAKAMRLAMYQDARELALGEYRNYRTAEGAGFAKEMRDEFQALHPGKDVRVDSDPSGLVVGINGYFPTGTESAPPPETEDRLGPIALAALGAGAAGLAIYLFRIPTRSVT